jgi:hypothetical protein
MPRPIFVLSVVIVAALSACGRSAGHDAGMRPDAGGGSDGQGAADAPGPDAVMGGDVADVTASPDASPDTAIDGEWPDGGADGEGGATLVPYHALGVVLGDRFACALRDDHSVFCWGTNAPKVDLVPGRTVIKLAAAEEKVCGILDDGSVTCWSFSANTQLTTTAALDLPAGRRVIQLAMSGFTTFVVLDDQTVFYSSGAKTGIIQRPAGSASIRQIAPGYAGQLGAVYEDGTYAPEVTLGLSQPFLLGADHAQVLTMTAARSVDMWCWAKVGGGTMCEGAPAAVVPDPTMPLVELVAGTSFFCGRRLDGTVRCWGTFAGCDEGAASLSYWCDGQAATDHAHDVRLGMPAVSLAANDDETTRLACAVLVDGSVKCWGGADVECVMGTSCQAPAQQDPVLGDSVEIVPAGAAGARTYGAWRAVDIGSHP